MAVELFTANRAAATVTSGGTDAPAGGTSETWTVASSAMFGAAATGVSQFHVADPAAPSEIIAVTNVSGTTWTVTRGAENTTPVTHSAGFAAYQVSTAGWLGQVVAAGYPSSSKAMPLYLVPPPSGDASGATDQAAITALETAAASGGGLLQFAPGTYYVTGLVKQSGTLWQGAGREVTIIMLADGANADVVQGANFGSLTGTGSYGGIQGWTLRDLCIDGNRANQTGPSWGLRIYGCGYSIENVTIRYCYSDGHWSEFGYLGVVNDGIEASYQNVRIHHSGGWGWHGRGPHDSLANGVICYQNNQANGTAGNFWFEDDRSTKLYQMGGLQMVNCHSWGLSPVCWGVINDSNIVMSGCQLEGSVYGAILVRGALSLVGGKIFYLNPGTGGTGNALGCGIQLGDDGSTPGVPSSFVYQAFRCKIFTGTESFCGVGRSSAPLAWVSANHCMVFIANEPIAYTVAAASDGQPIGSLPGNQLFVNAPNGNQDFSLPPAGTLYVHTSAGGAQVTYTSVTSGSNPSVNGVSVVTGSGTVSTGFELGGSVLGGTAYDNLSTVMLDNNTGNQFTRSLTSISQYGGSINFEGGQSGEALRLSQNGTNILNTDLSQSPPQTQFNDGVFLIGYAGNYSNNTWAIDTAKGHMNWPSTSAPSGAIVTTAIGTAGNGAAVTVTGNDKRGTIAVVTASTGLGGSWPAVAVNFTFASTYATSSPRVVITPQDGPSAGVQPYAKGFSATQFNLGFNSAPATAATYTFTYNVSG